MAEILVTRGVQAVATGLNPEGHRWMNAFWYDLGTTPLDQATSDYIAGVLATAYGSMATKLSASWSLDDFIVTDRRTAGAPQFHSPPSVTLIGGDGGQPLPGMVNALVSWTTAFRGREGRGRTFLTGFCEDSSNGGGIEGATQTVINDFADTIRDEGLFSIATLYKGVAIATSGSRRKKPIPRNPGFLHLITGFTVPGAWYTQRRRRN